MSRSRLTTPHHDRRRRAVAVLLAMVLALATSGCALRLLDPPGEGLVRYRDALFTEVTKTGGITYGSAVNQSGTTVSLALDLYRPQGDTVTSRPAIIWVHGGSFRGGSRTSPEIVDQAREFARKGFVTASISYRLADPGCTTIGSSCLTAIVDAKHDAQAAVRFLRAHATEYGIDTSRVAIAGTSAGAITALNVAYGSEDVGTSGTPGESSEVKAAVSLSGARILTTPSAGEPGALLFHGTADTLVPYQWALDTVSEAEAAGLTVELTSWEGEGHVPYVAHRTEILDQTRNFLWWVMDLTNAAT